MKILQRSKKSLKAEDFNISDFVVLNYEQLLKVNGAGGGGGGPSGPSVTVPTKPSDVDLEANVKEAKDMSIKEFYNAVRNNGPWDYKQKGSEYQDFGNFNYGLTGKAAGIPDSILLRGAGWAQEQAGTSSPDWGKWYGSAP